MKKIVTIICMAIITSYDYAQTEPKVFLNHLFFVFDSATFNRLFVDNYLLSIGDTSMKTTSTTTSSWTGKYVMGRQSYLEFFSSSGFKQVPEQGFGFGFMTYKSGAIRQIIDAWKTNGKDSIESDTTIIPDKNGKLYPWFYSIGLYTPDSLQAVSVWLMENTPYEFRNVGFTNEEIKRPISWEQYAEKLHHKKLGKPFNRISAIEIITNAKEYIYFKKSLLAFGLKDDGKRFYNNEVQIKYSIANVSSTQLKSAKIELAEALPKSEFIVSGHLGVYVNGKTAIVKFNY